MATVDLSVFLPELATHVAGCPNPLITNALTTAATEFCTRTLCWQERLAAVDVTKSSFPYTIPVASHAAHATLVRVMAAQIENLILKPTSYEDLDHLPAWDTQEGTPYGFLITSQGTLLAYPLPSEATTLRLTVALTVERAATVLEEFLYIRWRDVLVHGALRILHAMPDKPWSKPDLVGLHTKPFEQGVAAARVEANRSQMVANQAVQMRPFT